MEPIRSDLNIQRVVGRTINQALVESEIPLPAGRDAQRILYAQGEIENGVSRCMDGKVLAEGTLLLNLLCLGRDDLPFGVRASTQYSHSIPMPDAAEGMMVAVDPQLMDLRCSLKDGRVRVEAVAEMNAVVTQQEKMQVLSDIAGVQNLQTLYENTDVGEWRVIGTEQRRIHENVSAPGAQQILLVDGKTQVTDIDLQPEGVHARGILYLSILYLDENGQYTHLNEKIPLEDTIHVDMDARTCGQVNVTARAYDLNATISQEPGILDVDFGVLLIANCIARTQTNMLSDAYTPNGNFNIVREPVEQLSTVAVSNRACSINEALHVPENMPDALRVIYAQARPTVLGVSNDNGQLAVNGILVTSVVYQTDEGTVMGFEEDVPFTCVLDAPYMPDADVNTTMLETRANGSGRTLTVQYLLDTNARLRELMSAMVAVDTEGAEPIARENGILIHYAGAGESLWNIGKNFGVLTEQIMGWNPNITEPLAEGQPVMILSAAGRKQ